MAYRDFARQRIFERFKVLLHDYEFDRIEENILRGRYFEYHDQDETRGIYVMNVDRVGGNLAVVWDKAARTIVTILPSRRSYRIIKGMPPNREERLVEYDNERARRKMKLKDHLFLRKDAAGNNVFLVQVYRPNGYTKKIEVLVDRSNPNKILGMELVSTVWQR